MGPKDKAIELRGKFIPSTKVFYNGDWKTDLTEAKKCALICVDEVIAFQPWDVYTWDQSKAATEYWNNVKLELNKL